MNINDTRTCNLLNLQLVAKYYEVDVAVFERYYDELLADKRFLEGLNERMRTVRTQYAFAKGIFQKGEVNSNDWFAFQRVLLYILIRHLRPERCLETGVIYEGNTAFILNALSKNGNGELVSIDLPDSKIRAAAPNTRHPFVGETEYYTEALTPGFIIPPYLHHQWRFIEGNRNQIIPTIPGPIGFAMHDSDHSLAFLRKELSLSQAKLEQRGTIVVDDIDWSNGFYEFCVVNRYYPLCLTDNGKEGLKVRTGLIRVNHPHASIPEVTGAAAERV